MRIYSAWQHRRRELTWPLVPLLSVVFAVMLCLAGAYGLRPAEVALTIGLPSREAEPPPGRADTSRPELDFESLEVRILWQADQPAYQINGVPLRGADELDARLKAVGAIYPAARLQLQPDRKVPLAVVVQICALCQRCGLQQVRLGAPTLAGSAAGAIR